jgi:hypothetical protein
MIISRASIELGTLAPAPLVAFIASSSLAANHKQQTLPFLLPSL